MRPVYDIPITSRRPSAAQAQTRGATMARKPEGSLGEGDTVGMTGEVVLVHEDGKVTIRLQGYDYPMNVRSEHLSLITKRGSAKRVTTQ